MTRIFQGFRAALGALAFLAAALAGAPAAAQFPSRPITIMVGFSPGGTSDVAARILAERMAVTLRTPVVVENRTGAGGSVAAAATTRNAPDGYSIYLADPGAYAINPLVFPQNSRYDSVNDFTAIALVGHSPLVVVTPSTRQHQSLADLTAFLRANPSRASYASSGVAGIAQFGSEVYLRRIGVEGVLHVPYRGGAPMMEALLKGEADFGVAVLASAMPLIEGGGVRALALASPSATPRMANVPLLAALGVSNAALSSWVIMIGPKGVPAPVVAQLNAAINEAIADPAVRQRLLVAGIEAYPPASPQETQAFLAREAAMFKGFQTELGDRLTR